MAATPTAFGFSPTVPSLSLTITNPNIPIWFFRPFSASKKIPTVGLSWSSTRGRNPLCSRISHTAGVAPKRGHVVLAVSGLMSSNSETDAELEPNNLNTCAGCQKYHELADNLGLVVEYDLREDIDVDTNTDEV